MRFAIDKKVELGGLTLEELCQFGDEFDADFYDAVTLEATLDCHDVIGGTARARVSEALAETEERIRAVLNTSRLEAVHAGA